MPTRPFLVYSALLLGGLTACGDDLPDPRHGVPALPVLWILDSSVFNHTELLGDVLVGSDLQTSTIKAVNVVTHQPAWASNQHVEQIAGDKFASDGQFLYAVGDQPSAALLVYTADGALRNRVPLPEDGDIQTNSGPQLTADRLYLSARRQLLAFDRAALASGTPAPVWTIRLPDGEAVVSLTLDADGLPIVGSNGGHIYALDRAGQVRWAVNNNPAGYTTFKTADALVVDGGTVYASVARGLLQAYDTTTGTPRWNAQWPNYNNCPGQGAPAAGYLAVADGVVVVSPEGGYCLSAFRTGDGGSAWVFESPNHLTFDNDPLVLRGVLYASNSTLWAIDLQSGQALAAGVFDRHAGTSANVLYDAARNQLLLWGDQLTAYRPLR